MPRQDGMNEKDLRGIRAKTWALHAFGQRPDDKQLALWAKTASMGEILLMRMILDEPYEQQTYERTSTKAGDDKWVEQINSRERSLNV